MKEWFILGLTVFNSLMIIAVSGQTTMLKEKLSGSSRKPSQAETEEWEQRLLSLREDPPTPLTHPGLFKRRPSSVQLPDPNRLGY